MKFSLRTKESLWTTLWIAMQILELHAILEGIHDWNTLTSFGRLMLSGCMVGFLQASLLLLWSVKIFNLRTKESLWATLWIAMQILELHAILEGIHDWNTLTSFGRLMLSGCMVGFLQASLLLLWSMKIFMATSREGCSSSNQIKPY